MLKIIDWALSGYIERFYGKMLLNCLIFLLQIFEESASDYDNNPEIIPRTEYNCHVTGTIPMYPFRYLLL